MAKRTSIPSLRLFRDDLRGVAHNPAAHDFWTAVHAGHPRFTTAVAADARVTALRRGERHRYRSRLDTALQVLRLCLVTESFLGQCCYRAKAGLQARGIPLAPRILHHLAVQFGQVNIGDPVMIEPGIHIPHGQVCLDGVIRVGSGTTISPFVTIGLRAGDLAGPTIGHHVMIGTGAKILGPVHIGAHATIGANAVVVRDVPTEATAVGVPAAIAAAASLPLSPGPPTGARG